MNIRKIASAYSIFIGLSILVMWIMFWITDQIPELNSEPLRIGMHLAAEFATAILLIVAGFALFIGYKQGLHIFQISMGMLIYTLIQSPGYFAQQGENVFVGMFAIFLIISLSLTAHTLLKPEENLKRVK